MPTSGSEGANNEAEANRASLSDRKDDLAGPCASAEAVARSIVSGDKKAFAGLYDRFSPFLYALSLRIVNDETLAEEVLGEVFLRLWRAPEVCRDYQGEFIACAALLTRRIALERLRERAQHNPIHDYDAPVAPRPSSVTATCVTAPEPSSLLDHIQQEQREIIELALFKGLNCSQISAITGKAQGTIRRQIRHAMDAVRNSRAPTHPQEDGNGTKKK